MGESKPGTACCNALGEGLVVFRIFPQGRGLCLPILALLHPQTNGYSLMYWKHSSQFGMRQWELANKKNWRNKGSEQFGNGGGRTFSCASDSKSRRKGFLQFPP